MKPQIIARRLQEARQIEYLKFHPNFNEISCYSRSNDRLTSKNKFFQQFLVGVVVTSRALTSVPRVRFPYWEHLFVNFFRRGKKLGLRTSSESSCGRGGNLNRRFQLRPNFHRAENAGELLLSIRVLVVTKGHPIRNQDCPMAAGRLGCSATVFLTRCNAAYNMNCSNCTQNRDKPSQITNVIFIKFIVPRPAFGRKLIKAAVYCDPMCGSYIICR